MEARFFPQSALSKNQEDFSLSIPSEIELRHDWAQGNYIFTLTPFFRWDQNDDERTHFDLREFNILGIGQRWELRLGIGKVFWGVTESQHLVDFINQTDFLEDIDGEDKLGQPMIHLTLLPEWGTVEFFVLPGFRERTFPGPEGRLSLRPIIDTDNPVYDSSQKERHVDAALRWTVVKNGWDVGLNYFHGTSRDPTFELEFNANSEPILRPRYDIVHQAGLDVQWTSGNWLLKWESIGRKGQKDDFIALTAGFEYMLVGIFDTSIDLGLIGEYLFDSRADDATTPFDDDVMAGCRWAFNDPQSTEMLFTAIYDPTSHARFFNVEASRRIGDHFQLAIDSRMLVNLSKKDFLFSLRNDDFVSISLTYFF